MSHRTTCLAVAALAVALPATAQERAHELHAELLVGTAWSLPTPLDVHLPGEAPRRLRARYATRPLADAPYYAYRVGVGPLAARGSATGVEGELVHHKLYLEHPPPPVEHFEVTHGHNLLTANAMRPAGRFTVRLGVGLVIAHPEGRIAGQRVGGSRRTVLRGGYHVAGVTTQLAVGRDYALGRGRTALYAAPEAKLTASLARVPLGDAGGTILVPNIALHALAGLGVRHRAR
jgi:hypothetical protein